MRQHFFTGKGDDGTTGWLGAGRLRKNDPRIETLGNLDECTSLIGTARAVINSPEISPTLVQIQRDLYAIMTEISADSKNASRFQRIDEAKVIWLENQIAEISASTPMPEDFILPGDSLPGAFVDNARTSTRKAERRTVEFIGKGTVHNPFILAYLNRLSSFLFVLEMKVNRSAGVDHPLLAGRPQV
ncbi:MAG: cob(I)yrinic acid a,c-diamide adenosyltransferase [Anaerolineaceae bacterium]